MTKVEGSEVVLGVEFLATRELELLITSLYSSSVCSAFSSNMQKSEVRLSCIVCLSVGFLIRLS